MGARRRRRLAVFALTLILLLCAGAGVAVYLFMDDRARPPLAQPPPDVLEALRDTRTVEVTTTTRSWTKVREVVTVDRLRTDRTLWRRMHFGDWDRVPRPLREMGLLAMIHAYAWVFEGSDAWQRMTPRDWDAVPQPIRGMAFLRMIWHWARVEEIGREFDLRPDRLAQTVGAIVMAESWFEHRAINENQWGNRDLGLAQCSDFCREELVVMAHEGAISFEPAPWEYFNPWIATRIATVWFERELLAASGDVELAIRAYHRGPDDAMDERGDAYLARVLRLRDRYIRTQRASRSWKFLAEQIAHLPGWPEPAPDIAR